MTAAVILGMIVTMFPEPVRAGQGDRRLQLRRRGGRRDRPARRRRADAGDQLALDLLRQPADRDRHRRSSPRGCSRPTTGIGLEHGADAPGAVLLVSVADARASTRSSRPATTRWGSAHTLGFGALAVALLGGVRRPPGAAANPLMPLRVFRSRTVTVANLIQVLMVAGHVRDVLPGRAVPAAGAALRRDRGRACVPARSRSGSPRCRCGFAARLMMRFGAQPTLIAGLVLVAAGLLLFRRAPVDAGYAQRPAAGDGAARRGRGAGVPVADDARDVGGHAGGLGPRLGAREHHPAGRRRARTGGARDAFDDPHQLAPRPRGLDAPSRSPTAITWRSRSQPGWCWRRSRRPGPAPAGRGAARRQRALPVGVADEEIVLEEAA